MEYVILCIIMFVTLLLSVNILYFLDVRAWGIKKATILWNIALFGKITFPLAFPVRWFISKSGKWR